jgi:hypothetical protein
MTTPPVPIKRHLQRNTPPAGSNGQPINKKVAFGQGMDAGTKKFGSGPGLMEATDAGIQTLIAQIENLGFNHESWFKN